MIIFCLEDGNIKDLLQFLYMRAFKLLSFRSSLVIEDDIGPPDDLRGNTDGGDIFIFLWVPSEFVIIPFLQKIMNHNYAL